MYLRGNRNVVLQFTAAYRARGELEMSEDLIKCIRGAAEELGYRYMKPEQLQLVLKFVEGSDVFAVLPTGFGKSLCYACLPLVFDAILKSKRRHSRHSCNTSSSYYEGSG